MSLVPESTSAVAAQLAFTRIDDVEDDPKGRGLRRARTLDAEAAKDAGSYDRRVCRAWDCSELGGTGPALREHGFARADLSPLSELQAVLARVRDAGHLGDADAGEIRRRLLRRSLALSGGDRLRLLFLAREGFFLRRAGPNGMRLHEDGTRRGMNGHDAAMMVHADQDIDGTPLRQILGGLAPRLFHHESPDRSNLRSRLFLINLWIPLEQVTRPLALMDRRSLDRRTQQLRYGLPTDGFLRRRPGMRVNDIWSFVHDDSQRWYFSAAMDAGTAYVFETLSTPHGALILPGEDRAEARYQQLMAAIAGVQRRDDLAVARALAGDGSDEVRSEPVTVPLCAAIAAMDAVIAEGRALGPALGRGPTDWCARAARAAERVVRRSLEMRAVAWLTPQERG